MTPNLFWPQPLDWFSHRDTDLFCNFLIKWPSLQTIKKARSVTIKKFFKSYGGDAVSNTAKRIDAINISLPLTEDTAVIVPHQMLVVALCKQVMTLVGNIRVYDKAIRELFQKMPDATLFESSPGTGPCLAPRLLAAIGEDRSRFNSALEIQNYAGLSLVTDRSGQSHWVHWRWQCAKFVRQSFIEWAEKSVYQSYRTGLYYAKQKAKGKSHQQSVRALAYKWVRIVYKCWKSKTPYDESKYLKALEARNSPLFAASNTC